MDRLPLHLVENKQLELLEKFRELLFGGSESKSGRIAETASSIEYLMEEDEFTHLVSTLLAPFQHLVAAALRVKEIEKEEMKESAGRPIALGVRSDPIAKRVFQREHDQVLRKKWGVGINDSTPNQLRKMIKEIEKGLADKLTAMKNRIHNFPEKADILGQLSLDRQPLIYILLLAVFEKFLILVNELEKQFVLIQYSLNVLYAPLYVDHGLNDQTLVKLLRVVNYLEALINGILNNDDFCKLEILEKLLDDTKIYPSWHAELNQLELILAGKPDLSADNCRTFADGLKSASLTRFLTKERKKLMGNRTAINFTITGKSTDSFSELATVIDLKKPSSESHSAENLEGALAMVSDQLDRSLNLQYDLLDLMENLIESGYLDEAELLDRLYQLMTLSINLPEYNEAEKHYAVWVENKLRVEKLLKNKRRAEIKLKTVELPTTTTTSPEPTSTEPTSTESAGTSRG